MITESDTGTKVELLNLLQAVKKVEQQIVAQKQKNSSFLMEFYVFTS
jgi:hypothetical protein